jgi:Predicted pyridoxal phosphate-dependent enzyme apparently involved in regulation of cell wall biogenesis
VEQYLYSPVYHQGMHRDYFTFTAKCQKCATGCSEKYFDLRQSNRRPRSSIVLLIYPNSEEEEVDRVCIMHGIDEKHGRLGCLGGGVPC